MSREVEVIFYRHAERLPNTDSVTSRGLKDAQLVGKKLKQLTSAYTKFYTSPRKRTKVTAKNIMEVAGFDANKLRERTRFNYGVPGSPQISPEMHSYQKQYGIPRAFKAWMKGRFNDGGMTPEETGILLAKWLRFPFKISQTDGKPVRLIVVTHGYSHLETLFFVLTGKNPTKIGQKGAFKFLESFNMVINGKDIRIKFRNKKFNVLPKWKKYFNIKPESKKIIESIKKKLEKRRVKRNLKKR